MHRMIGIDAMKMQENVTTAENAPLPLFERMSYLIYVVALFALLCIVHEPESGVSSMKPSHPAQPVRIEPSRDFPPPHHQPASARTPLTTRDSMIQPSRISQLKQYARPRRDGID